MYDSFDDIPPAPRPEDSPEELLGRHPWSYAILRKYVDEARARRKWNEPEGLPTGREILDSPKSAQADLATAILLYGGWLDRHYAAADRLWALQGLLTRLLRRVLPFDEEPLVAFLDAASRATMSRIFVPPYESILKQVERCAAREGLPASVVEALTILDGAILMDTGPRERRIRHRFDLLLGRHLPVLLEAGEPWADVAIAEIETLPEPDHSVWLNLIAHCRRAKGRPTRTWWSRAEDLLDTIGDEEFRDRVFGWFERVGERPLLEGHPDDADFDYTSWLRNTEPLYASNRTVLVGLVRCAGRHDDPETARALGDLAEECLRRIPHYGPLCRRVGFAAVAGLGDMTDPAGRARLERLLAVVAPGPARRKVAQTLQTSS